MTITKERKTELIDQFKRGVPERFGLGLLLFGDGVFALCNQSPRFGRAIAMFGRIE